MNEEYCGCHGNQAIAIAHKRRHNFEKTNHAKYNFFIFSSPELKALLWVYKIGSHPSSVIRRRWDSSITIASIKVSFIWSFYGVGKRKFVQMVLGTWPIWPPCPYMVKSVRNLFRNQKADDLENVVCRIGCSSSAKFVQIMSLVWPWNI